jgi:hypothetical protein
VRHRRAPLTPHASLAPARAQDGNPFSGDVTMGGGIGKVYSGAAATDGLGTCVACAHYACFLRVRVRVCVCVCLTRVRVVWRGAG